MRVLGYYIRVLYEGIIVLGYYIMVFDSYLLLLY